MASGKLDQKLSYKTQEEKKKLRVDTAGMKWWCVTVDCTLFNKCCWLKIYLQGLSDTWLTTCFNTIRMKKWFLFLLEMKPAQRISWVSCDIWINAKAGVARFSVECFDGKSTRRKTLWRLWDDRPMTGTALLRMDQLTRLWLIRQTWRSQLDFLLLGSKGHTRWIRVIHSWRQTAEWITLTDWEEEQFSTEPPLLMSCRETRSSGFTAEADQIGNGFRQAIKNTTEQ